MSPADALAEARRMLDRNVSTPWRLACEVADRTGRHWMEVERRIEDATVEAVARMLREGR